MADVSKLPDPKNNSELMDELTEKRKEKILRYKLEKDRKQSLGAGLLLKHCLEEYGVNVEDIYYGVNGKPEVEGICFNLSHSQDMVVCVISEEPVGCDIERIGMLREGIAERYFTDSEAKHLAQFEGDAKKEEFYRLWTMKESYMKMTGEGSSLALNRFEFVFEDEIKVFRDNVLCSCKIKEYPISGYKLTVCAEEDDFADSIICAEGRVDVYEDTKVYFIESCYSDDFYRLCR